jgi:hypothetical protein
VARLGHRAENACPGLVPGQERRSVEPEADGIRNDFASNALTTVPNYTRSVAGAIAGGKGKRAIAVIGRKQGELTTPQNAVPVAADKRDVARAAIKVEVR